MVWKIAIPLLGSVKHRVEVWSAASLLLSLRLSARAAWMIAMVVLAITGGVLVIVPSRGSPF